MATKGPSNRYGNTNGANHKGEATKHINYEYAETFRHDTLSQHFQDHGKEFNSKSKADYASKATHFANSIDRQNYKSVVDKQGNTYKWNTKTGETVIVRPDKVVISYSHMVKKGFHYTDKKGIQRWIKI